MLQLRKYLHMLLFGYRLSICEAVGIGTGHRAVIEEMIGGHLIATTWIAGLLVGLSGGGRATEENKRRARYVESHLDRNVIYEKFLELYSLEFNEDEAKDVISFMRTESGKRWRETEKQFSFLLEKGRTPNEAEKELVSALSPTDNANISNFLTKTTSGKLFAAVNLRVQEQIDAHFKETVIRLWKASEHQNASVGVRHD